MMNDGISHILSGRNNPSLDFVVKMLERYESLSTDWLLFGRGPMYRYTSQPTLFEAEPLNRTQDESRHEAVPESDPDAFAGPGARESASDREKTVAGSVSVREKRLEKVLLFYTDKTFSEYISS